MPPDLTEVKAAQGDEEQNSGNDDAGETLLAGGRTSLMSVDDGMRPRRLSAQLLERFQALLEL